MYKISPHKNNILTRHFFGQGKKSKITVLSTIRNCLHSKNTRTTSFFFLLNHKTILPTDRWFLV